MTFLEHENRSCFPSHYLFMRLSTFAVNIYLMVFSYHILLFKTKSMYESYFFDLNGLRFSCLHTRPIAKLSWQLWLCFSRVPHLRLMIALVSLSCRKIRYIRYVWFNQGEKDYALADRGRQDKETLGSSTFERDWERLVFSLRIVEFRLYISTSIMLCSWEAICHFLKDAEYKDHVVLQQSNYILSGTKTCVTSRSFQNDVLMHLRFSTNLIGTHKSKGCFLLVGC